MTDLEQLAERCEKASGPDRELDVAVFRAIGAPAPFQFASKMIALSYDEDENCYFAPVGDMRVRYEPPAYTASLDAAMTLVPEGCGWLGNDTHIERWAQIVRESHLDDGDRLIGGLASAKASSLPLALCAAALRAIAANRK